MSVYDQLALLYVEKNAQPGDTPEKLISLYRYALDKITKYDREHKDQAFSFE